MRRVSSTQPAIRRRGQALLLAVIVLVLTATITTTLARTTLQRYRQCERAALAVQAECIAESALVRGLQAAETDANYTGETWNLIVPGSDYGPAQIVITCDPQRIQVDVLLPVDAPVPDMGTYGGPAEALVGEELERLVRTLEEEMHEASADLRFEYAARLRDEIKDLERELRELA